MQGREHLVGISAQGKGLMLEILRYAHELRDPEPYFEKVTAEPKEDAVGMAAELIERQSGKFEPKKMLDEYAKAVKELVRAKVQHRAPKVRIEPETHETPKVINIMAALKKGMQAKGRENMRDAVRKRMGKRSAEQFPPKTRTTSTAKKSTPRRVTH